MDAILQCDSDAVVRKSGSIDIILKYGTDDKSKWKDERFHFKFPLRFSNLEEFNDVKYSQSYGS